MHCRFTTVQPCHIDQICFVFTCLHMPIKIQMPVFTCLWTFTCPQAKFNLST